MLLILYPDLALAPVFAHALDPYNVPALICFGSFSCSYSYPAPVSIHTPSSAPTPTLSLAPV